MSADDLGQLFDEWAAGFARGERPDAAEYLDRAGEQREEFARLVEAYLRSAPRPEPDAETVELVEAWIRGEAPLVALRVRRGLTRDAVVDSLLEELRLAPEKRPFLRRRYHELEAGLLGGGRLSRRLVDALSRLLDVPGEAIRTWRPRRVEATLAFRAAAPSEAVDYSMVRSAVQEHDAEVDSLFLSGE